MKVRVPARKLLVAGATKGATARRAVTMGVAEVDRVRAFEVYCGYENLLPSRSNRTDS